MVHEGGAARRAVLQVGRDFTGPPLTRPRCGSCKGYQPGIKQLSIEQLAPSLCIQVKGRGQGEGREERRRGKQGREEGRKVEGSFKIVAMQIKRFESQRGGAGGQQSFKVDTHVTFPLRLNMSPYMSKQVFRG